MLVALLALLPAAGTAQGSLHAGGSAAVPLARLGDIAELGFQTGLGATFALGRGGAVVGIEGFYGRNAHRIAGERSDLYGATVRAGYAIPFAGDVRLTPWVGLAGAVHARKSEPYPGLEASRRGLSLTGGATLSKGVGGIRVFASAFYLRGLGRLGGDTFPTELVSLGGGIEVPLGLD
jgi:hypothetical protein